VTIALGIMAERGYVYSCNPPAGIDPERDLVRRFVREIDPRIRPLWLTKVWKAHTGGIERRTFAALAFQSDGLVKQHVHELDGLILPTGPNDCGLRYTPHLFNLSVLDGLEMFAIENGVPPGEAERVASKMRQAGAIGTYTPLRDAFAEARAKSWWARNHEEERADEASKVRTRALQAMSDDARNEEAATVKVREELRHAERSDRLQRHTTVYQAGHSGRAIPARSDVRRSA
jgi:hypothetical protein